MVTYVLLAGVAPPPGQRSDGWMTAAFAGVLLLVAGWACAGHVVARVSGWRSLARAYGSRAPFHGPLENHLTLRIGRFAYWRCTEVGVDDSSVYFRVPLFRAGHLSLCVPHGDLRLVRSNDWLRLHVTQRPEMRIEVDAPRLWLYLAKRNMEVDVGGRLRRLPPSRTSLEPLSGTIDRCG